MNRAAAVRHLLRHVYQASSWSRLLGHFSGNRDAARSHWEWVEKWARTAPRRKAGLVAKGRG